MEGSFYMGIQFPPTAFLYLLYFYICIYIFILYIGKRIIKLKLKQNAAKYGR